MESPQPVRIAMWSGPRNISTAMMRSWGNRADTIVVDEPLYAFYLAATGKNHPGAGEIITSGETDSDKVISQLVAPLPAGKRVFFQKHMTHHLLAEVNREWLRSVTNCFLIRDPAEVIRSYIKKNDNPTLEDIGFPQQAEIFALVERETGRPGPVIDAHDVLDNPERMQRLLCEAVGVEFDQAMLSWPPGPRETDGVWAKHWYGEVEKSTGFGPYRPNSEPLPDKFREIEARARESYDRLYQYRLTVR